MTYRAPGRKDGNQAFQQTVFEAFGGVTQDTSGVKGGMVDWIGCYYGQGRGHVVLVETKDPSQPPSKRTLTKAEEAWHATWLDHGADVVVWETEAQIERWIRSKQ